MTDKLSKRDRARLKAWLEVLGLCLADFYDELEGLGMATDDSLLAAANIRSELNWFHDFVKKEGELTHKLGRVDA